MSRLPRSWTPATMSSRIAVHTECAGMRMTDLRLNPRETSTIDACSVTLGQSAGISDGGAESMDIFWTAVGRKSRMPRLVEPGHSACRAVGSQTFTPWERR
ncbi:hypothetical protein GCM10010377_05380 [Streptomyces viridiviolaceus]|nr:hypothetical protein GCM10010377_05380 [Streptomyces viridiviolaceus]